MYGSYICSIHSEKEPFTRLFSVFFNCNDDTLYVITSDEDGNDKMLLSFDASGNIGVKKGSETVFLRDLPGVETENISYEGFDHRGEPKSYRFRMKIGDSVETIASGDLTLIRPLIETGYITAEINVAKALLSNDYFVQWLNKLNNS